MIKYIVRSLKYLLQLIILVGLIMAIAGLLSDPGVGLVGALKAQLSTDRASWLLVGIVALAAFYPLFGYVSRRAKADLKADRDAIVRAMKAGGYELTAESADSLTFRADNPSRRLILMYEDPITVTAAPGGVVVTGRRKQVVNNLWRIEHYLRKNEE